MAEEPRNPAARVRTQGADWLRPTRAVAIAFDVRKVVLAAVGLLALQAAWIDTGRFSPGSSTAIGPAGVIAGAQPGQGAGSPSAILRAAVGKLADPALVLIAPLGISAWRETSLGAAAGSLLNAVMAVIVFGIIGGAIARSAAMEAARGERLSLVSSLRFAFKHAVALIAAPLFLLLAMMFCVLLAAPFGLTLHLPGGVGAVVGGIVFVVPLALGFVAAVLLINLMAAWPLMLSATAAEGEDAMEALTRALGCVGRRPVQFAALAALVGFVGCAGLVVVELAAGWALHLAAPALKAPPPFWGSAVGFLVQAWAYAYFWSSSTMIYLTLRRDIDGADWSEVAA